MKLCVPLKRVPDPYAKVGVLPDGSGLDLAGVKLDINPFDEIALEEAVRNKERDASIHVTVVCLADRSAEEVLRKALAMGADEAVLIECDEASLDPEVVASELAAWVRTNSPDLVLMGKQATDDDRGQVGRRLAAKLEWPLVAYASKLTIDQGSLEVVRESDDGRETWRMGLPGVVTVDLRLNEPRYIALPGIIKARSKPLHVVARATDAVPQLRSLGLSSPPSRAAGRKVDTPEEVFEAIVQALGGSL